MKFRNGIGVPPTSLGRQHAAWGLGPHHIISCSTSTAYRRWWAQTPCERGSRNPSFQVSSPQVSPAAKARAGQLMRAEETFHQCGGGVAVWSACPHCCSLLLERAGLRRTLLAAAAGEAVVRGRTSRQARSKTHQTPLRHRLLLPRNASPPPLYILPACFPSSPLGLFLSLLGPVPGALPLLCWCCACPFAPTTLWDLRV